MNFSATSKTAFYEHCGYGQFLCPIARFPFSLTEEGAAKDTIPTCLVRLHRSRCVIAPFAHQVFGGILIDAQLRQGIFGDLLGYNFERVCKINHSRGVIKSLTDITYEREKDALNQQMLSVASNPA